MYIHSSHGCSANPEAARTKKHGQAAAQRSQRAQRTSVAGAWSSLAPANQPSVTVMRFSVSVPVLSEQIAVAPPIVSQAASTRTKLLSCKGARMCTCEVLL